MSDYARIPTSAEVWAVIHARHKDDLGVYATFSAPDGDPNGNPDVGRMETAYGLRGSDYPLMEARTTWEIDRSQPHRRLNEKHEYWLCVPKKDD